MKMNKKLTSFCKILAFTVVMTNCSLTQTVLAAPKEISVTKEEYNVPVEEAPVGMNAEDIYAKFNRSNMDVDKYQLWFFDDYDSQAALEDALKKSGDNIDNYEKLAMDVLLYEEDSSDGEYYPVTQNYPMTVIMPVPSEFEGMERDLKLLMVNKSGKGLLSELELGLLLGLELELLLESELDPDLPLNLHLDLPLNLRLDLRLDLQTHHINIFHMYLY